MSTDASTPTPNSHLESRGEQPLEPLDRLLAEDRVPVREGFSTQVMSSLPKASWQSQSSRPWLWVAALVAAFALGGTLLLGTGGVGGSPIGAVADLLVTTLTAGAGFLTASWSGIGTVVDAALGGSTAAILGLGAAALAAYALLFGLLRRRRARVVEKS